MLLSWFGAVVAFGCSFSENHDVVSKGCATGTGVAVMSGTYTTYTTSKKYNAKIHGE
jgi:hypothetical protein